nr:Uma2 family endonuclease [Chloroflexaceae bacterium]
MTTPIVVPPDIDYPDSDGKPMAESDVHRKCMTDCIETLDDFFRHERLVYVGGNMLFYYEKGNREASFVPDVFVIQGVTKELRRSYKLWEEARPPTVIFEITSRSTQHDVICLWI